MSEDLGTLPRVASRFFTATSIDGFIADEQHSLDWLLRLDDGGGADFNRFIAAVGAILMGSTTYD